MMVFRPQGVLDQPLLDRLRGRRSEEGTMLLEVEGISMVFGGLAALRDVSFSLARESPGPDRPNGAGKTTLFM